MIDKIIEFIISILDLFRFWEVISHWEEGVRVRLGKWTKTILKPGFHWRWPFMIDIILTIGIKPEVAELEPQTVTTLDNIVVGVQAVVKYEISDASKALLEVGDEVMALKELTQTFIRSTIIKSNYSEINSKDIEADVKALSKREAEKWGIRLVSVKFKSLGKMISIRLMQ